MFCRRITLNILVFIAQKNMNNTKHTFRIIEQTLDGTIIQTIPSYSAARLTTSILYYTLYVMFV